MRILSFVSILIALAAACTSPPEPTAAELAADHWKGSVQISYEDGWETTFREGTLDVTTNERGLHIANGLGFAWDVELAYNDGYDSEWRTLDGGTVVVAYAYDTDSLFFAARPPTADLLQAVRAQGGHDESGQALPPADPSAVDAIPIESIHMRLVRATDPRLQAVLDCGPVVGCYPY